MKIRGREIKLLLILACVNSSVCGITCRMDKLKKIGV